MRHQVVVFARAPRLGTVKRRLAREIGERAALRFHLATLSALISELRQDRRFRTVLAITPDRARVHLSVAQRAQGAGDLGRRMQRACDAYRRGRVALIGSDIPEAGGSDIRAAFRALGTADAAFGPAPDGGYWLVALGPRRPARPFARVRWSGPHALADTLRNFAGRRVALLRTLRDVDTGSDLAALGLLRGRLQVLGEPRHQLDKVARPMSAIELPEQDVIPSIFHRTRAAGQCE
jgi:rSAM/selenodomain-associated transferase 1